MWLFLFDKKYKSMVYYIRRYIFLHIEWECEMDMARQLKDSRSVCIKMDERIAQRLDEFVNKTGLSKTATIEKSVQFFLDRYEKTGKIDVCVGEQD